MLVGRIDSSGEFYQYFHDGLGSITMIVDSFGQYQNLYTYDDFGNFRKNQEEIPNHYCYTGQERDENPSGLYNLRARYYASGIGRFTQEDPIDYDWGRPQRMNLYAYVMNNPINRLDPLGLSCHPIFPPRTNEYIWKKRKEYSRSPWLLRNAAILYSTPGWIALHCVWIKEYSIFGTVTRVTKQLYECTDKNKKTYYEYRITSESVREELLGWDIEEVKKTGFAPEDAGGLFPEQLCKDYLYPRAQ